MATITSEETLKAGVSTKEAPTQVKPPISIGMFSSGKSLGFGFSSLNKPKVSLPAGCEDYVTLIEASDNFSTTYSLVNPPKADILQGKIISVIFKVSESQLQQTATYHFWKKSYAEPDSYVIVVSTKDRQLDSIEYNAIDSISTKFFKITDANTVDIIEYSAPGM